MYADEEDIQVFTTKEEGSEILSIMCRGHYKNMKIDIFSLMCLNTEIDLIN